MLPIIDIVQIFLLCALIMLPVGHLFGARFLRLLAKMRYFFFSPRYLNSEGVLRCNPSAKVDRKHE